MSKSRPNFTHFAPPPVKIRGGVGEISELRFLSLPRTETDLMGIVSTTAENSGLLKNKEAENVAIANALQLEASRRRATLSALISSPVSSLNSLSLSVAVLERFYCLYVILRCDLEL